MGCDIDMRVIKGYGIGYTKPEQPLKNGCKINTKGMSNIFTNFKDYKLAPPTILRVDINHTPFRRSEYFDAIVCDPPYGHRAFSRKTGMEDEKREKRKDRLRKKYGKLIQEEEIEVNDFEDEEEYINSKNLVFDNAKITDPYHFAPLKQCSIDAIFSNLLNLGNLTLKKGGALVCLYPTSIAKGEEE